MENLLGRVEAHFRAGYENVFSKNIDYHQVACDNLSENRVTEQLSLLQDQLQRNLEGLRILELGSGYGAFLITARTKFGAEAYGIEPAPKEFFGTIEGCRDLFRLHGEPVRFASATGEQLPFVDNAFDAVCSFEVLEHTLVPEDVIDESLRVLKPGGRLVMTIPNYGSWWEGHYGLLWPPHMPKWAARIYVRMFGRDPSYIDSLQFITVKQLRRILSRRGDRAEVLSMGYDVWERRLLSLNFSEWAALGRLKRIVKLIHRMRVHYWVARIGKLLEWQTPIILVVQKKQIASDGGQGAGS
jgi:SAM-dependent methyltransferase